MALATTPLLPFNPIYYNNTLIEMYEQLVKDHGNTLKEHGISLGKYFVQSMR